MERQRDREIDRETQDTRSWSKIDRSRLRIKEREGRREIERAREREETVVI